MKLGCVRYDSYITERGLHYLSVQIRNIESSDFEFRNSFMFVRRISCAKAAWNGMTLMLIPFLSNRFNMFSTFLQVSICGHDKEKAEIHCSYDEGYENCYKV